MTLGVVNELDLSRNESRGRRGADSREEDMDEIICHHLKLLFTNKIIFCLFLPKAKFDVKNNRIKVPLGSEKNPILL